MNNMFAIPRVRTLPCLLTGLLLLTFSAKAQISVGPLGAGPLPFNTPPTVAEGWSTLSVGTAAGAYTTDAALDAAVSANTDANAVITPLGASQTYPPSANAIARWNTNAVNGFFLQTRPTSVDYLLLMATLRNDSGADHGSLVVTCDWAEHGAGGGAVAEQIPGHRCFYSLTGAPGSWILIPELSTFTTTSPAQTLNANLVFSTPWVAGGLLYIIWADDNSSGGTGSGADQEGSYSIDNFSATFGINPPVISQEPAGVTNNEYSVSTLTVTAVGTAPFSYQWYRNGNVIPDGTRASLAVTNTAGSGLTWSTPNDSGDYHVVITGQASPPATSAVAHVVVLADQVPPRFLWALGTNDATGSVIQVRLSEPVTSIETEPLVWTIGKVSGPGADLESPESVSVVGNDVFLSYPNGPIDPNTSYTVTYDGAAVFDLAQTPNQLTPATVSLWAHPAVLLAMNAVWRLNDAEDPGPNWFTPAYDDTVPSWSAGPGPFDAKRGGNGAVGADCRDTSLYNLGPVGTCVRLTNSATGLTNITTYFRTHFNFAGSEPTNAILLLDGKVDDGAIFYLNGVELRRIGMAAGAVSTSTLANRTVNDTDAQDSALLFAPSLQTGDNLLAAEVHQVNLTSSDITLGLQFTAVTIEPAAAAAMTVHIAHDPLSGVITVTWSGGTLQESGDLGSPSWTDVSPTGPNTYVFTPAAGAGQRFFRARQ